MPDAVHPQAKKDPGHCPVQAMQQLEGDALGGGRRRQPCRLVLRRHRRPVDFRRIRCRGLRLDEPQQIAHLRHPGEILLGDPDAEDGLQLETEVQPLQRVDAEIELRVGVQRQPAPGIARLQDPPRRSRLRPGQQCPILVRQRLLDARAAARERLVVQPRQQEALVLAEPVARQRLARDDEPGQALVAREALRGRGERDPHHRFHRGVGGGADRRRVRHDERDQRATALEHRNFANERAGPVALLQFLRKYLLAAPENDDLLQAAADVDIAVVVHPPEIAGTEPAVLGERRPVGVGIVEVAREDARPPQLDFTFAPRIRIGDTHPAVRKQRPAFAADALRSDRVAGKAGGGFGQPVAGQRREPEPLELPDHVRLELGPGRHQKPQARPEPPVHLREQDPPERKAEPAANGDRQPQQHREQTRRRPATRLDLRLQAADQRLVQARHADHRGGLRDIERSDDLRPRRRLRQDDGSADGERNQQSHDEGVDMMQRQRQQHAVARADQAHFADGSDIDLDIAVGEDERFRAARGARRVDQHRRRVAGEHRQAEAVLPGGQAGPGPDVGLVSPVLVDQDRLRFEPVTQTPQHLQMRPHGEQAPQSARADDHRRFVGVGEVVDRHRHRPGHRDAEASDDPGRAVGGHQADALARTDSRPHQTESQRAHAVGDVAVAVRAYIVAAHFEYGRSRHRVGADDRAEKQIRTRDLPGCSSRGRNPPAAEIQVRPRLRHRDCAVLSGARAYLVRRRSVVRPELTGW